MKNVKNTLAIALALLTTVSSFAQVPVADFQNDIPEDLSGPIVTDLSHLPSFKKLQQTPGWGDADSDVALGLVRKYLKEKEEGMPIDCEFKTTGLIQKKYAANETASRVENQIRRYGQPIVTFKQAGIWATYPDDAIGFTPSHSNDPEWIDFSQNVLPSLAIDFKKAYERSEPAGLRKLVLLGYTRVCADIKNYLQARFRVNTNTVSCVSDAQFDRETLDISQAGTTDGSYSGIHKVTGSMGTWFYKMTYPVADGYEYRKIKLDHCTFESQRVSTETAQILTQEAQAPTISAAEAARTAKALEREARLEEKRKKQEEVIAKRPVREAGEDFATFKARRIEEQKALQAERKAAHDEAVRLEKSQTTVSPKVPEAPEVHSSTKHGKLMIDQYRKLQGKKWTNQSQFSIDEQKIEPLIEKVKTKEYSYSSKDKRVYTPKKGDEKRRVVQLDPKRPYELVSIPIDFALTSEQLQKILELIPERDHEWMMGCTPRSVVQIDAEGNELPLKSFVDCIVPRFEVMRTDPNKRGYLVGIPYPTLRRAEQSVKKACGESKGSVVMTGGGIGFGKLGLFHLPTKKSSFWVTHRGSKIKDLPTSFEVNAGFNGKVFDLITLKPVSGAQTSVENINGVLNQTTTGEGFYEFPDLPLKGLKKEVRGSHRLYHDGKVGITNLEVGEISPQPDLFLDPKRVTLRGTITETFTPKYGSGIASLKVSLTGYPQFVGVTNDKGEYVIENVPVTLESVSIEDVTRGHETASFSMALTLDQENANRNGKVVPNLTILKGFVRTPDGMPAPGLKVSLIGHPELSAVTNANGSYEIKDIPAAITGLHLTATEESIYKSKGEAMSRLNAYVANDKDITVAYSKSDISGRVYDVVSKTPIAGAKIVVEGSNGLLSAVSDSNGRYLIKKVPETARRLNIEFADKSYVTRPRILDPLPGTAREIKNQDFRLVPRAYSENKIVFVLTWNNQQYDLDSQLFFPDGTHLYFKTLRDNSMNQGGGGSLDRDDTGNDGRETTIITLNDGKTVLRGDYQFLVFQYVSNGITFEQAEARVEIYRDGEFWQEVKPSAGKGRLWYVGNVSEDKVKIVDKFPAGDLYEKMDELQLELKDLQANINHEGRVQASLENQLATLKAQETNDQAMLEQFNRELADLKLAPPSTSVEVPVTAAPPVTAPVVPAPAAVTTAPGTAAPAPGTPVPAPAPVPLTPVQQKEKDIADLKKKIAAYPAKQASLTRESQEKVAKLPKLQTEFAAREEAVKVEIAALEAELQKLLETYR